MDISRTIYCVFDWIVLWLISVRSFTINSMKCFGLLLVFLYVAKFLFSVMSDMLNNIVKVAVEFGRLNALSRGVELPVWHLFVCIV